jgi:hypothetical protein
LHLAELERVKLCIIQQTILEVKLVNHLVCHGKIDIGKIAFIEPNATQRNIVDFSIFEITIEKSTIDKRNGFESAIRKVAVTKRTILKFFVLGIVVVKNVKLKFLIQDIIGSHNGNLSGKSTK